MEPQKCSFGEGEAWQRPVDPDKFCPLSRDSPCDLPRIRTHRGAPALAVLSRTDNVARKVRPSRKRILHLMGFLFPRLSKSKLTSKNGTCTRSPCMLTELRSHSTR